MIAKLLSLSEKAFKPIEPEVLAENPPKFLDDPKLWRDIVLRGRHTSYGGAVNHYKASKAKRERETPVKPKGKTARRKMEVTYIHPRTGKKRKVQVGTALRDRNHPAYRQAWDMIMKESAYGVSFFGTRVAGVWDVVEESPARRVSRERMTSMKKIEVLQDGKWIVRGYVVDSPDLPKKYRNNFFRSYSEAIRYYKKYIDND